MEDIYALIRSLGIYPVYIGYCYLAAAIELVLDDESSLAFVSKEIYPEIARVYGTSPSCVERNMRTVIASCWQRGNRELLCRMAGYRLNGKPTTGEFISILAFYIKSHR